MGMFGLCCSGVGPYYQDCLFKGNQSRRGYKTYPRRRLNLTTKSKIQIQNSNESKTKQNKIKRGTEQCEADAELFRYRQCIYRAVRRWSGEAVGCVSKRGEGGLCCGEGAIYPNPVASPPLGLHPRPPSRRLPSRPLLSLIDLAVEA